MIYYRWIILCNLFDLSLGIQNDIRFWFPPCCSSGDVSFLLFLWRFNALTLYSNESLVSIVLVHLVVIVFVLFSESAVVSVCISCVAQSYERGISSKVIILSFSKIMVLVLSSRRNVP